MGERKKEQRREGEDGEDERKKNGPRKQDENSHCSTSKLLLFRSSLSSLKMGEKCSSSKSEKIPFSLLEILCYARLWLTVLLSHYPFFFPDFLSWFLFLSLQLLFLSRFSFFFLPVTRPSVSFIPKIVVLVLLKDGMRRKRERWGRKVQACVS